MLWREVRRGIRMCVPGVIFWAYVFQVVVCVPLVLLSPTRLGNLEAWLTFLMAPWVSRLIMVDKPDLALGRRWRAPWWRLQWGATVLPIERWCIAAFGLLFVYAWLVPLVFAFTTNTYVLGVLEAYLTNGLRAPGAFLRLQEFAVFMMAAAYLGLVLMPYVLTGCITYARRAGLRALRVAHYSLCPKCRYSLLGLEQRKCPECGRPFHIETIRDYWRDTYRTWRQIHAKKLRRLRAKRRKQRAEK
ncbi:MAG: hypothetical protein GC200_01485 [Tepidisphaera sp.]|nr:hypothetical protein [Tepidisphaera sp.]